MKKLLWVINPHAGRGAVGDKVVDCVSIFQRAGYEVTLYTTQGVHDATRVVQARAEEFDRIVCAGGDGTLNEVVTGLMHAPVRPPLGYIPTGTTNDFASTLNIPRTPLEAARIAAGDTLHALDIGRFNDRYFNYIAGFGAFTSVAYATPQQSKNLFGRAAYILEGIRSLATIKEHHIRLRCKEKQLDDSFIYGMVSNSVSVGGFKSLTPGDVALDDGLYEVLLVYPCENPMELQWLASDLLARNTSSSQFEYFQTSTLEIESDESVPWTLDGEFGGETQRVEIENFSRAITFVTGEAEAAE